MTMISHVGEPRWRFLKEDNKNYQDQTAFDKENSSHHQNDDAASISYEDYVPTTVDRDFTVETILFCLFVLLLLAPMTWAAKNCKKKRRVVKQKAQEAAEQDAKYLAETWVASPTFPKDELESNAAANAKAANTNTMSEAVDRLLSSMELFVQQTDTQQRTLTVEMRRANGRLVKHAIASQSIFSSRRQERIYRDHLGKTLSKTIADASTTAATPVEKEETTTTALSTVAEATTTTDTTPTTPFVTMPDNDSGNVATNAEKVAAQSDSSTRAAPPPPNVASGSFVLLTWKSLATINQNDACCARLGDVDENAVDDIKEVKDDDTGEEDDEEEEDCDTKGMATCERVFACDRESKRIFSLAIPSTIGSATSTVTSAVSTAMISYNLGVENYVAYSMVYVVFGFVDALYGGIESAKSLLVAQAIGASNYYLAGQYEQAGFLLEWMCAVPLYTVTYLLYDELISLMGLEPEVAQLGKTYIPWYLVGCVFSSMYTTITELMWADERGTSMTVLDNIYNGIYLGLLALLLIGHNSIGIEQPTLGDLGKLYVTTSLLYATMVFGLVWGMGWINPYRSGLFSGFSFSNGSLAGTMIRMSLPLTLGGIVSTCQWELLTFFAAHMGSPEVAAWSLLGSVWDILEYFPGGFTTATELRVSSHLGNGRPGMAKVAAYKCLVYSIGMTIVVSTVFVSLRVPITELYTNVEVIQEMLSDLILLVGVANVVMVIGVIAYSILCAQNRTSIASGTYAVLSLAVTLPLSVYFVYFREYDLQSVVFALIVGYASSSLVLIVLVLISNWNLYSKKITERSTKEIQEQEQAEESMEATDYSAMP